MAPFCGARIILNWSKLALATVIFFVFLHLLVSHNVLFSTKSTKICENAQGDNCANDATTLSSSPPPPTSSQPIQRSASQPTITVAITICGNTSMAQGLNALKSALIMSSASTMLHFEIMTDQHQMSAISEKLNELKRKRSNFTYKLRPVEYPNRSTAPTWRKLFKECASQRLFLPDILRDVDSVLYIDTDVLFVSPVESVWGHFSRMNGSQIAGMSYESEDFSTSWYYRFAKHPYYGYYGLNSGVMLMNLTRMRAFRWVDRLEPVLRQYRSQIVWGDQDIINVIFHEHPAMLYLFGCNWNYRPDHCVYASVCKAAAVEDKAEKGNAEGIRLVHGNRGVFLHDDKQPEFRALYLAFSRLPLLEDVHRTRSYLAESIRTALAELPNPSRCAKVSHLFWRQIAQTIPSGGSTQSKEERG